MKWMLMVIAATLVVLGLGVGCEKNDDSTQPNGSDDALDVPDSLALARTFPRLLANGEDEIVIYATVVDASGRGLSDIGVRFETSHGTISPFATTDTRGVAEATLTSAASAGDLLATVTARASADTSSGTEAWLVALSRIPFEPEHLARLRARHAEAIAASVPAVLRSTTGDWVTLLDQVTVPLTGVTLSLAADPTTIPADGLSSSELRATLIETTRRVPLAGETVRFGATAGAITGSAVTDEAGIAEATLRAAPGSTGADVTAYYGQELTAQAQVAFSALALQLSSPVTALFANGASTTTVTAVLLTTQGNPVAGARIDFTTSLGMIVSPLETDADGRAATTLAAGLQTGVAEVAASFAGTLSETLEIDFVPPPVTATLLLAASALTLPADGLSEAQLTATALDEWGDPMPDGTPVLFALIDGAGEIVSPLAATEGGLARAVYVAGTTAGPVLLEAGSGGARDEASLVLTPLGIGAVTLSADAAEILADGVEATELTAVVTDALGNPVAPGTQVQFSTSSGVLEAIAPTDATGTATARLRATRFETGTARVTASAGGHQATVDVALVSEAAAHIVVVSVEPPAIGVLGSGDVETSTIVFSAQDRNGIPVDLGHAVTIAFEILADATDATIHPATAVTNARGEASTTVNAGTLSGTVEVQAMAGSLISEPIRVSIHGGQPDAEHFAIAFEKVNVAGLVYAGLQDHVTAYVGDRYGNPVPLGTRVWFQAEYGLVQGSDETDDLGQATVTAVTAAPFPQIPGGDGLVRITAQTVGEEAEDLTTYGHILWSGHTILEIVSPETLDVPNGGSVTIVFRVRDANENPLTAGTAIALTATAGTLIGDTDLTLPDTQSRAYTTFYAVLADDDSETDDPRDVWVSIEVTSQNGNRSALLGGQMR